MEECVEPDKSSELVNSRKNNNLMCCTFVVISSSVVFISLFTLYLFLSHISFDLRKEEFSLIRCNRAHYNKTKNPNSRAIVSIITEDKAEYIRYAQVLAYSLRSAGKISCDYDMIMLHSCQLKAQSIQTLEFAQWKIVEISPIAFPNTTVIPMSKKFYKMFSKLHIFNMTDYKAVLYIDSDAFVVKQLAGMLDKSIEKMNDLNVQLAWGIDCGKYAWSLHNAGVMLVTPSHALFTDLVLKINIIEFDARLSEQSYLNKYFENNSLLLPTTMNAMPFLHTGDVWKFVKNDIIIIHWAFIKPDSLGAIYKCWWFDRLKECRMWTKYVNFFQI
tara:strand:- start:8 stop:997 length:990 start_codon:yes stop_codon:yes gene_type:complete